MKIKEIITLLDGSIVSGKKQIDKSINFGLAADLLSDVLTVETENVILVTGLTNLQTIRTAEMADIACVVFARGKKVSDEMISLAERNGLVLIECDYSVFKVAGMLYEAGINPVY